MLLNNWIIIMPTCFMMLHTKNKAREINFYIPLKHLKNNSFFFSYCYNNLNVLRTIPLKQTWHPGYGNFTSLQWLGGHPKRVKIHQKWENCFNGSSSYFGAVTGYNVPFIIWNSPYKESPTWNKELLNYQSEMLFNP